MRTKRPLLRERGGGGGRRTETCEIKELGMFWCFNTPIEIFHAQNLPLSVAKKFHELGSKIFQH